MGVWFAHGIRRTPCAWDAGLTDWVAVPGLAIVTSGGWQTLALGRTPCVRRPAGAGGCRGRCWAASGWPAWQLCTACLATVSGPAPAFFSLFACLPPCSPAVWRLKPPQPCPARVCWGARWGVREVEGGRRRSEAHQLARGSVSRRAMPAPGGRGHPLSRPCSPQGRATGQGRGIFGGAPVGRRGVQQCLSGRRGACRSIVVHQCTSPHSRAPMMASRSMLLCCFILCRCRTVYLEILSQGGCHRLSCARGAHPPGLSQAQAGARRGSKLEGTGAEGL